MPHDRLTPKQRQLLKEVESLAEWFDLDHYNIASYEPAARTPHLAVMKDKMIRSQVITWYTLVDEYLNMALARYFFGRTRPFPVLWKTKRFQFFNFHLLEELSLLQKLRYVKAIRRIPKPIVVTIERLNALRNGLAHALFPENLKKSKPVYRGKNIFTLEGVELLGEDMGEVTAYFLKV